MKILILSLIALLSPALSFGAAFDGSQPGGGVSASTADADYLQVDGGNAMTGPLTGVGTSSATFQGGGKFAVASGSVTIGGNPSTNRALLHIGSGSTVPSAPFDTESQIYIGRPGNINITLFQESASVQGNIRCDTEQCDFRTATGHPVVLKSQGESRGVLRVGKVSGWVDTDNSLSVLGAAVVAGSATVSGNFETSNGRFAVAGGTVTANGAIVPGIRTKAQIDALPGILGAQIICSDCTVPYDICVGTGTGTSGYRAVLNSAINTAVPGTLVPKGCGSGN